jgi:hypothetical protein
MQIRFTIWTKAKYYGIFSKSSCNQHQMYWQRNGFGLQRKLLFSVGVFYSLQIFHIWYFLVFTLKITPRYDIWIQYRMKSGSGFKGELFSPGHWLIPYGMISMTIYTIVFLSPLPVLRICHCAQLNPLLKIIYMVISKKILH